MGCCWGGDLGKSIKQGKLLTNSFFPIMKNEVLKTCKSQSIDVKQQEIKGLVAVS